MRIIIIRIRYRPCSRVGSSIRNFVASAVLILGSGRSSLRIIGFRSVCLGSGVGFVSVDCSEVEDLDCESEARFFVDRFPYAP